ncbi:MAG: murein biosynthesis integral membrane protein MurJ [Thermoanaerobaculia bacterium]
MADAPEGAATAGAGEAPAPNRSRVVAAGILLSRLMGFARQRAVAHYFGVSGWADVLVFALRAPNLLQNLLGEGTLSASFIPVYSRMLAEGRREEAGRLAGAVFGLLLALAAALALLGVLFAEPIVAVLASGFLREGEAAVDRYPLAVAAVRITFPMTGFLVLHAWALGVLNSHRRFFLPYVAPVLWNAAIVAFLVGAGQLLVAGGVGGPDARIAGVTRDRLLIAACIGALVGGALQFLVQVPLVFRVLSGFRLTLSTRVEGVRATLRAVGPVVAGRGGVQLGSYLDVWLATLLVQGAVAALGFAQLLYTLPISLFAMSVAAAELPELSRLGEDGESGRRVERSLGQIAFLVVPTAVGYLLFGYLLAGAVFRTGSFGAGSTVLVYLVLVAYTVGLPASAASRLFQNAFFALGDTRTPAVVVLQRVLLAAAVAVPAMFALDRAAVPELVPGAAEEGLRLGAVGLAVGSVAGAWYELVRLLRALERRGRPVRVPWRRLAAMAGIAAAAAAPASLLWYALPDLHPVAAAAPVLGAYAGLYLGAARLAGLPELGLWLGRLGRRKGTPDGGGRGSH